MVLAEEEGGGVWSFTKFHRAAKETKGVYTKTELCKHSGGFLPFFAGSLPNIAHKAVDVALGYLLE